MGMIDNVNSEQQMRQIAANLMGVNLSDDDSKILWDLLKKYKR